MPVTRKPKAESKVEEAKEDAFKLSNDKHVEEVYVDGLSQFLLGTNVSKLTLYSNVGDDQREHILRIAIPTASLLLACKRVLVSAKEKEENINRLSLRVSQRITSLLSDVDFEIGGDE